MIGDVFVALLAGHYAGDFLAQTDHQSVHKAGPWREDVLDQYGAKTGKKRWTGALPAMYGHLASYLICQSTALILLDVFTPADLPATAGYAALVFSIATHGFIDRRWPVVWWGERTGSAAFVAKDNPLNGRFHVDQAMHIVCLYLAALLFAWVA